MKYYILLILLLLSSLTYSQKIYTPYKRELIKITIRTMVNSNINPNELSEHDIVNIGSYDIRIKLYLTKNVSLIDRTVITGINTTKYYYSLGLVYKF